MKAKKTRGEVSLTPHSPFMPSRFKCPTQSRTSDQMLHPSIQTLLKIFAYSVNFLRLAVLPVIQRLYFTNVKL